MKKSILLFISLIYVAFFSNVLYAYDDGDFQFWISQSISGKINDSWSMKLTNEERFGDDAQQHYRHHSDLGISHKIDDRWKVGFHFRYITEKKSSGWQYEHRYYANATYKFLFKGFDMSNKVQAEFRHKDNNDFYRFRDKLTINLPQIGIFKPFIADEVFTDTEEEKLNRNRLYIGIKNKINDNLYAKAYYLWQRDKKPDYWKDTNVIGISLSFKF